MTTNFHFSEIRKMKKPDESLRWLPIPDRPSYLFSETGLIWSVKSKKYLPCVNPNAERLSVRVGCRDYRATLVICELVAKGFVENPDLEKNKYIYFKDGNQHNNHYTNLIWSANSYSLDENDKWEDFYLSPLSHEISILGIRPKGGKILKPSDNNNYPAVQIISVKHGIDVNISLHVAMAKQFIPNPFNKSEVNHLDGNTRNWSPDNLEWSTRSENMKHAHKNGLISRATGTKIEEFNLKGDVIKIHPSFAQLSESLNISEGILSRKIHPEKFFCIDQRIFKIIVPDIIEGEIWKNVNTQNEDHNRRFEVSNKGRVRRTKDGRHLCQFITKTGYYKVKFYR